MDYQILIIFGTNVPDITGHQMTTQRRSVSALPGGNRTSKVLHFYLMQY